MMEIIKDTLKVEEQRGFEEIESLIETEIYLDQTKAEIGEILWTDGKVEILSTKIIKDKILINGLLKFKVIYRSNEEELNIYTLETNKDFREEIEIDGIAENMAGEVKPNLEYIEYELEDERKVSLRALVKMVGKVEETVMVEIIEEVVGDDHLQLLKEKIQYNDVLERDESYALIKEAFEVGENQPEIEEILKLDFHPYEKEYSISADRIIVSGIVETSIIYFGENKLNSIKREIPFTHFIELSNIEYDSKCQLNMEVVNGEFELRENLEGRLKIVDLELKIKIKSKIYSQREKEVIIDAYSTERKINLKTEEIRIMENIKDITVKESISKEINVINFKEIYLVEAYPIVVDSQYVEDKVMVEGILTLNIYYQDDVEDEIRTIKEELPFKSYITAEGLDSHIIINSDTSLEELHYNLKDKVLHISGTIKNHIFINRERKIKIISEMEETDELIDKKSWPSIIIYMVQKDDILWDIAKRYNTTVEEIIESNNIISPSSLMPGEKIIIEKKIRMEF
ncbi:SPOCS domain-containing protein [Tepidimicrobium xylanilyticum]|uniref:SPOCS domain-containing protein n=1 Tax=Tepidimicrobium xylanilyticum TaxID=1123352 RepID=UPI00264B3315|nr:SPOCS domain-containing protein [Tepidimicrobium xylanilyticum]GMG95248.1 spore coat protein [Tepidimicrobium xylanilyticum]